MQKYWEPNGFFSEDQLDSAIKSAETDIKKVRNKLMGIEEPVEVVEKVLIGFFWNNTSILFSSATQSNIYFRKSPIFH